MTNINELSSEAKRVLKALCDSAEGNSFNGSVDVYLDNARAKLRPMNETTFRSYLAVLSKAGLYVPHDGYAWGSVKDEAFQPCV